LCHLYQSLYGILFIKASNLDNMIKQSSIFVNLVYSGTIGTPRIDNKSHELIFVTSFRKRRILNGICLFTFLIENIVNREK